MTAETEADITTFLSYCFDTLETGRHPTVDFHRQTVFDRDRLAKAGTTFAGGWCFAFGAWTGDIKDYWGFTQLLLLLLLPLLRGFTQLHPYANRIPQCCPRQVRI